MRWAIVVVVIFSGLTVACQDELPSSEPPSDVVRALWNPADAVMPTPTDLVRDDEEGRLAIPVDDDATAAENAFLGYLNGLDGYPLSTPIKIPVSAPVDQGSLGRGIRLVTVPGNEQIPIDSHYDAQAEAIIVEPRQELMPGQRYAIGVRGYEMGVVGAGGETMIADAPFFLVRSTEPLTEHPDAVPGDTLSEREELAKELTEIQEGLAPGFSAMAGLGIERDDLAVLAIFTTTEMPAIRFDVAAGEVPLPNDLLVAPDGTGIELPIDDEMSDEEQNIRRSLSKMDGFGMSSSITVNSTHDIDGEEPPPQAFRLFKRAESGQWVEESDLERGILDNGHTAWLRPALTLEPDSEYAYVVTHDLRTSTGVGHRAQPLAAMMALEAPLIDDEGRSELPQLSDDDAQRMEPLRRRSEELLDQLTATEGLDRAEVAAAVPFRTARVAETLLERRAKLYDEEITTAVTDIEKIEPSDAIWDLLTDVESVVHGEMTILDHLDPMTREFYEDGHAEERSVKFVLTLPEDVPVEKPIPVVLFGHGLMTSRELVYLIAGELASAGFAAFSFDLPYHGARSVCIRDNNCRDGGVCEKDGQCRNPDGSKGELDELTVSYLVPLLSETPYGELLHYPTTTGEVFIDMNSIPGTRDHFAQSYLDLNQAVRVIRGEEFKEAVVDETGLWLGDEILYLGMSLGGILGSGLMAIEPQIDDFVVNVPAADVFRLVEHSVAFETAFSNALEHRDIERDSDEYFTFMNALRWILDPIDPLNLVQHVAEDRLTYVEPENEEIIDDRQARVLIQMAEGDKVVPNIGTEYLSARMGIDYVKYSPLLTDHGFLFDPSGLSTASRNAREDIIEFYESR